MRWCEDNGVDCVLGLARNARLVRRIAKALRRSLRRWAKTREALRRFREFRCRTRKSWSRWRRVVAKAEHLAKGPNPRFVVTSLGREVAGAQRLCEVLHCARGDMENRIKERQLDLFADRTGTATLRANQLRLHLSSFACVPMHGLRRLGFAGTRWARAQCGTLRSKLLKVAARVRITARRVWLSFPSACPRAAEFAHAAALRRQPTRAPLAWPRARPENGTPAAPAGGGACLGGSPRRGPPPWMCTSGTEGEGGAVLPGPSAALRALTKCAPNPRTRPSRSALQLVRYAG